MKTILMILTLTVLASCGNDGDSTVYQMPAGLQGGTWIAVTGTTGQSQELVFNADHTVEITVVNPPAASVTTTHGTNDYWKDSFLVNYPLGTGTLQTWKYSNLTGNTVTICINHVDAPTDCKNYTR